MVKNYKTNIIWTLFIKKIYLIFFGFELDGSIIFWKKKFIDYQLDIFFRTISQSHTTHCAQRFKVNICYPGILHCCSLCVQWNDRSQKSISGENTSNGVNHSPILVTIFQEKILESYMEKLWNGIPEAQFLQTLAAGQSAQQVYQRGNGTDVQNRALCHHVILSACLPHVVSMLPACC